ncbi:hypothetical protein PtA15_16A382 [Puccinia triticina]|uniref:Uncharacterized protein n=1 Tax=Puccinia triticina TaxID=208348 RepID=A0ABY7D4A9_9BASI|nr:uncharacterized protein PtA15_16A382 [Puccinia triticina]WAQ92474.1 hypothetical protein PtA15_16A382 [Puccinia triticina]WAR64219.1 hypothetical protein PtB15_16B379 [Puccinia triticina]
MNRRMPSGIDDIPNETRQYSPSSYESPPARPSRSEQEEYEWQQEAAPAMDAQLHASRRQAQQSSRVNRPLFGRQSSGQTMQSQHDLMIEQARNSARTRNLEREFEYLHRHRSAADSDQNQFRN